MNRIFNALRLQALGVINLTLPIVMMYYFLPTIFYSWYGAMVCSIIMGIYITYLNYRMTKNQEAVLKYTPAGEFREQFEQEILSCNLDPHNINLRYSYSHEAIAMTLFNTVVIDPILWSDIDHDNDALKVRDIVQEHIMPQVTSAQRMRLTQIRELLSPAVQRFIFKHELGHVSHHYSYRKLCVIAIIGFFATYCGIYAAMKMPMLASGAVFVGMLVGGLVDLLLSYSSNLFFKYYEEKRADIFAAHYSSAEDIAGAADFFEKHQHMLNNDSSRGWVRMVPMALLSGHADGVARAHFLRQLSQAKSIE